MNRGRGTSKMCSPSEGTLNKAKASPFGRHSSSQPQRNDGFRCKQVSRLGLILLARLPAQAFTEGEQACTVALFRVRPLHGYWDSPEISSAFPWRAQAARAAPHGADAPAIHLSPAIIRRFFVRVNAPAQVQASCPHADGCDLPKRLGCAHRFPGFLLSILAALWYTKNGVCCPCCVRAAYDPA